MVDSRGPMRELIPLGRSIAANSEDFARPGELQAGRSVVGGRRGGRIVRVEVLAVQCLCLRRGLGTQFPLQHGMHLTSEAPNAYKNRRARHRSPQHLALFQRSVVGLQNRRTNKGLMKLVIIADGRCLCDLKVIAGSTWKAST